MARKRLLEGKENVARVFKQIPQESVERITHALNKGGEEIAAAARPAAPVGDYAGAGDLRGSVDVVPGRIKVRGDGKGVVVYVVAGTDEGGMAYARVQEFGRSPGGAEDNAGHPGHAAQPFMFPAYWSRRRRVLGRIRSEIRKAARVVAARGRQS